MILKLVLVVNLGCYVSFQFLFTFHDNFSGLFIIWRWGVFVHFPRSLCGCYALSLQWSLVKACGYYVPLCKYTYPCLCFIFFFFHVLIGIQLYSNWLFIDLSVCIRLCRYVEVNMDSAAIVWPLFNSLQAFWPGLQVFSLFSFCLPCNMKMSYELLKLLWFGVICINDIERF